MTATASTPAGGETTGRAWVPLWSAVLVVLGCVPLGDAYAWPWTTALLAGVVAVTFGVTALGSWWRLPRWGVAVGVLGVAAVWGTVVARSASGADEAASRPGASPLAPLFDSLPRLLTAPRPAPVEPALLVPAVLLVAVVALAVAVAVVDLRGPAGRPGVAGLVGTAVLQVGAALLTAGAADDGGLVAIATVAVAGVGWVIAAARRRASQAGERRVRHGLVLPGIAALVAAVLGVGAVALPTAGAFEPRRYVEPPTLPASAVNPIPDVTGWQRAGDDVLFTVAAADGELPRRMTLAVLPDFDGASWRLDARLRALGVVEEPDLPPGDVQREVTLDVVVAGLDGAWAPTTGRAGEVVGIAPLVDVATGTLVLVEPLGADAAYRVTARVDAPEAGAVARAGAPPADAAARYLALPRVSPDLLAEAQALTEGASSRLDQARAIEEGVRADRVLDRAAPSGSSYGRLAEFLFLPAEQGGRRGTAEQFAGAFAVLARAVGLPTRLVVGFEVGERGDAGPVEIHGEDAMIWPEVYLSGTGWVAFDPRPETETDSAGEQGAEPTPDTPEDVPEPPDPEDAVDPPAPPAAEGRDGRGTLATGSIVAGGLGVLAALVLAVVRGLRSRRQRLSGDVGAWERIEDAVVLSGGRLPRGMDAVSLAHGLDGTAGRDAVAVAERAEHEAFAPGAPAAARPRRSRGSRADPGTWDLVHDVVRDLRRRAPIGRRLIWWVSPAALRRRR